METHIDKLDDIFGYQMALQQRLGTFEKIVSQSDRQQFINQMILACHEEVVEIMRESAYKNPEYVKFGWKQGQTMNNEKRKEEIVDLVHFVVNLCLITGMSSNELYQRYVNKNKENHQRQDNGY